MLLKIKKLSSLALIVNLLFFCWITEAVAQKSKKPLSLADQREIIKVLLEEKFDGSAAEIIYISTKNLPDKLQNEFPPIKNVQVRLVSQENAAAADSCAYNFGKFEITAGYVSVTFGDCREGLAYDFKKVRGKWKSTSMTIKKETL